MGLLLVHYCMEMKQFLIIILCSVALLNAFISSDSFLVESLRFSIYSIMSSANSGSFTSSFLIWMPLFLFSCLVALAKATNIILNKGGVSGHPCFIPNVRKTVFSFPPLNMILAVGLSSMAFIMLRYVSSIFSLLRVFIINGCWIFSNGISALIEMILWFLSLIC